MNRRQARVKALELAYRSVELARDTAGDYVPDYDDEVKVAKQLDDIAQGLFERWQRSQKKERP